MGLVPERSKGTKPDTTLVHDYRLSELLSFCFREEASRGAPEDVAWDCGVDPDAAAVLLGGVGRPPLGARNPGGAAGGGGHRGGP